MTPDQIEEALEQPEFNKPLQELATARIAMEDATVAYGSALGEAVTQKDLDEASQELDDMEYEFFEKMASPFGELAGHEDAPTEIIKAYYLGIKARLLKPENRIKEAMNNG